MALTRSILFAAPDQALLSLGAMSASEQQPHLAINLIQLSAQYSGGLQTSAREMLPRLIDRLPGWRVSVLVNDEGERAYRDWDDRCEWVPVGISWHQRFRRIAWESTVMPLRLRRMKPTLLHSMTNTSFLRPGCPQVSLIADATQILEPAPSLASKAFRRLLISGARRADLVLTISDSAARDIERACGVSASDIRVVPLAARAPTVPLDRKAIEQRFDLPANVPYFVMPASKRANKNTERGLRAFAQFSDEAQPMLLLTGADDLGDDTLARMIEEFGIADRTRLLGWVSNEELDGLYASAIALVFPSLMEGFGLPILEAMQVGCPVATSDVSSMPEVAGDDAVYFDPTDVTAIAAAMSKLAADPELRARLRDNGLQRAQSFSWDRTADATVAIYRELLGPSPFRD